MTAPDIDAIQARADAAAIHGGWTALPTVDGGAYLMVGDPRFSANRIATFDHRADAEFAAAATRDIPALLADRDRLAEELAAAELIANAKLEELRPGVLAEIANLEAERDELIDARIDRDRLDAEIKRLREELSDEKASALRLTEDIGRRHEEADRLAAELKHGTSDALTLLGEENDRHAVEIGRLRELLEATLAARNVREKVMDHLYDARDRLDAEVKRLEAELETAERRGRDQAAREGTLRIGVQLECAYDQHIHSVPADVRRHGDGYGDGLKEAIQIARRTAAAAPAAENGASK